MDLIGRAGCDHTVSRLGGDEFVILLDLLQKPDDALVVAQRILDALSNPFSLAGQEIVSTASIGIVTSEFNYERAEDILRDADTAMYEAKNAGRAAPPSLTRPCAPASNADWNWRTAFARPSTPSSFSFTSSRLSRFEPAALKESKPCFAGNTHPWA